LNGDFLVVVAHSSKQDEVDEVVSKYNVLVQAYTNSMNLENDLRDKKDNVTIALVDRNMLPKLPEMKKKFPKVAFILESDNPND
jgi:5-methylcytosine-specific restriction endonuclease McrA